MHVFRIGRPRSQAACTCSGRSRWVLRSGRSALHWAVLSHFRRVQHGHFLIYPTTRRPLELICCPLETYRPSGGSPGKRSRLVVCCVVQKRSVSLACGMSATSATSGLRRGQRRQRRARKGAEDRSRAPWPPCRRCCSAS